MRPAREQTDQSLRAERQTTDQALVERLAGSEKRADDVVEHARERADAILDTARERVDRKLDAGEPGAGVRDAIGSGRALEDEVLHDERALADEVLRRSREDQALILAELRPLEREQTDRDLLTERSHADDQVANRDDFLGMVAHDLRSLLCGVVLEASQLSKRATDSAEGRQTLAGLKRLQRYAASMNRLIGDLVDVVSIDAGKLAVHPKRGDAAVLLAEAVDTFRPAALEKEIVLRLETGTPVLMADFDRERILQVITNLISNALKFTGHDGSVVVRGERLARGLQVSVTDTGVGIPGPMLEAVFERFWQAGENDRRGLGLGLHISKCMVDAHGGRIWAESQIGAGSVFVFMIPDALASAA